MDTEQRYTAFLSYAHADADTAMWLHRKLEGYRVPNRLVSSHPDVPKTLRPIFMDQEELNAAPDLGSRLQTALSSASYLILLCSNEASQSKWVGEEIDFYIRAKGRDRIIPILLGDGDPTLKFPAALLKGDDGEDLEPLGISLGTDRASRKTSVTRIASNLLGVEYAELADREQQQRNRRLRWIAGASFIGMSAALVLSFYALVQRNEARVQRDRAEFEAQTSEQISNFLIEMYALANPMTESADDLRATTILQRGAEGMEQRLKGQPALQARLMTSIARAYYGMGLLENSESLLTRAVELQETDPKTRAEAQVELGKIDWRNGEFSAAEARFAAAAELLDAQDHRLLGELNLSWGYTRLFQSDLSSSQFYFEKAVSEFQLAHPGALHLNQSRAYGSLGSVHGALGNLQEAIENYERAIHIQSQLGGSEHINMARLQANMGNLHLEGGNYVAALEAANQAIQIFRKVLGNAHPDIATVLYVRGVAELRLGDASAEDSLESALQLLTTAVDPNTELAADVRAELSRAVASQKRFDAALALHAENVPIYEGVYQDRRLAAAISRAHLGALYAIDGQQKKAEDACNNVLKEMENFPQHAELFDVLREDCTRYLAK